MSRNAVDFKLRVFSNFVATQGTTSNARPGPVEPGRRERNKAKRRDAVIDSTLHLMRKHDLADVSIERIAGRARVAPATVYNLFGSRERLLLATVDRLLERLVDDLVSIDPNDDPVAAATAVVRLSTEAFIADGPAFRQILVALGDLPGGAPRLSVDPAQLQIAAMRAAKERGILRDDVDPVAAGRQVYLSYNGALLAWARGRLTDEGLRLAAQHGLFGMLAALAHDDHRMGFVERLLALGPQLSEAGWGQTA